MKIKILICSLLTCFILSGLTTIMFILGVDKSETMRLIDQNQVKIPDTHNAASISKGTILLLLAVGVIGVLGVRKKKSLSTSSPKKETTGDPFPSDPSE